MINGAQEPTTVCRFAMDGATHTESGFFSGSARAVINPSLLALMFFAIALSSVATAVTPERFPPYSHTQLLRTDATLRAIAFSSDSNGVVCGDRGTILTTDDGGHSWKASTSGVDCRLSDLAWIDDRRVVIVGGGYDRITQISRAVVLISEDSGNRWRQLSVDDLPNLQSIERRRDGTLMAIGDWSHSMLTNRFQSHDQGKTWLADHDLRSKVADPFDLDPEQLGKWAAATGIPIAIRDACKIGKSTLFAVGDHGMILVSSDGGRTWSSTRGASNRTAVLIVARHRESVAWGLLGKEAIEHGNRVSLLIQQPNLESPGLADQVSVMLGGGGADAILPSSAENSNQKPGGSTVITAAGQWIAVHRPSVLVLDQTLDVETQDAFIQAATSASVSRVVVYRQGSGQTVIHRDALLPKSGVLVSDFASDANQFVVPHRAVPPSIALQYHYDVAASQRRGDSVTGGIRLDPGQTLTASLPPASRHQLQILQARRTQAARVTKLLETGQPPNQFAESLTSMLNQTVRDDQFRLAWSVFLETSRQRNEPTAIAYQQATLYEIATRFPNSSAGHWARLMSDSRKYSAEWQRVSKSVGVRAATSSVAKAVAVSPFQQPSDEIRQVSSVAPLVVPKLDTIDYQRRTKEPSVGVDLSWEFHPIVLIAREASRQRGDSGQLQSVDDTSSELKRLAHSTHDQWSPLVRQQSSQSMFAHRAAEPPKLDGILDDKCWESALTTATETRIRISYDAEFVYVGFETTDDRIRPDKVANKAQTLMRDRDLSVVDHLRLQIDTDRDLLTSFQFAVSAAGQTNEGVDGNLSWNPTWYRETRRDAGRITMEMAILRRDLIDLPIQPGESWYVSPQTVTAGQEIDYPVVPNPANWMRVEFR